MSGPYPVSLAAMGGVFLMTVGWALAGPTTPKKPVDWVQFNPAFKGATFVDDPDTCRACHEDSMGAYHDTAHARALGAKPPAPAGECESCHGPRSQHIEDPTIDLRFSALTPGQQSSICLQCHEGSSRFGWKAGAHHTSDVSCTSCHSVMERRSERALLIKATSSDTCYQCHADVRVETNKMSHHPVREGRMDCASCHNVHGSSAGLLIKNTVSETCYSCHTEKRGPFVWEHAPVRESCTNCHTPHGSNQPNLLASRSPFLCLNCHSYGGHVNLPRYNRVSNPVASGCANCHISVHGSNHPSGAKLTR